MTTYMVVGRLLKDYQKMGEPLLPAFRRAKCSGCGEDLAFSEEGGRRLSEPGPDALPVCNSCMYAQVRPGMEFRTTDHAAGILAREDEAGEKARKLMEAVQG